MMVTRGSKRPEMEGSGRCCAKLLLDANLHIEIGSPADQPIEEATSFLGNDFSSCTSRYAQSC
jgi:hypothetical protein